ncbi:MAG: NusA-like transcription termination signal-binding factor [Thermoproteota archaeon]|jgi:N utilization substance protein A|nr:NusA-like transcription termination signal-binding factor [Thermoproteota archaeon]
MKEGINLSNTELEFLNIFELTTSVKAKDCIIDDNFNRVIFLVEPKYVGLAIGKNGENVQLLKKIIKRDTEIIPYYEDPIELIKSCFSPFEIQDVKIITNPKGNKYALVYVDPEIKAKVIGYKGKNVGRARIISKRYFEISNVIVV